MVAELRAHSVSTTCSESSSCSSSSRPQSRSQVSCKGAEGKPRCSADDIPVSAAVLDAGAFEHFAPLLEACEDYARLTGCRFLGISYEALSLQPLRDVLTEGDLVLSTSGIASLDTLCRRTLAEVHAASTVADFERRLKMGEPELLSDLNRAMNIMMAEGVRNSLRVTCQQLGLWPPRAAPAGVEASDCFYFDAQADVPIVAQRLYNDERRRTQVLRSSGGIDVERTMAATASFLVDFAHEAGVPLPIMSSEQSAFLKQFALSAAAWEREHGSEPSQSELHVEDWSATNLAEAADLVRLDIKKWLDRALQLPALTVSS